MIQEAQGRSPLYLPQPATVTKVLQMAPLDRYFEFTLDSDKPLGHGPGQFVQISLPGIGECPISVTSCPGGELPFAMLIRRMGNVTAALHRLKPGDKVGIRGPFGTCFPVDTAMKGRDILFIGGGCGLAPLRSSIVYTLRFRQNYGKVFILYGCKEPRERLFVDDLKEFRGRSDITFLETVDRGDAAWKGHQGVITTLIPQIKLDPPATTAIVCGPPVMYKFVIAELIKMGIRREDTWISLERHMKCGVGKCGHCQIDHLYCCQDGPVFNLAQIGSLREAI
jgi:NAD(P)H-flavin reductase